MSGHIPALIFQIKDIIIMANAKVETSLANAAVYTPLSAAKLRAKGCVHVGDYAGFIIMKSPYGQVYKTRDANLEQMVKRYCKHARDYANQMVGISMFALERVETVVFSAQAANIESMSWFKMLSSSWDALYDKESRYYNRGKGKKPRGKSISQKRASTENVAEVIEVLKGRPDPEHMTKVLNAADRKIRKARKVAKTA